MTPAAFISLTIVAAGWSSAWLCCNWTSGVSWVLSRWMFRWLPDGPWMGRFGLLISFSPSLFSWVAVCSVCFWFSCRVTLFLSGGCRVPSYSLPRFAYWSDCFLWLRDGDFHLLLSPLHVCSFIVTGWGSRRFCFGLLGILSLCDHMEFSAHPWALLTTASWPSHPSTLGL